MATRTLPRNSTVGTTQFERTESQADPSQLQQQIAAPIPAAVSPTCQPIAASVEPLQILPFSGMTGPAVPQQSNPPRPASFEKIHGSHGSLEPMTTNKMTKRLRYQEIEIAGLKRKLKSLQEEFEKWKKETLEERTRLISSLLHPMAYSIHGQQLVQQQLHVPAPSYQALAYQPPVYHQASAYQPLARQPPAYQQPANQTPVYHQPAHQQPVHQAPAHQPPVPAVQSYTPAAAHQAPYDFNAYQQGEPQ